MGICSERQENLPENSKSKNFVHQEKIKQKPTLILKKDGMKHYSFQNSRCKAQKGLILFSFLSIKKAICVGLIVLEKQSDNTYVVQQSFKCKEHLLYMHPRKWLRFSSGTSSCGQWILICKWNYTFSDLQVKLLQIISSVEQK